MKKINIPAKKYGARVILISIAALFLGALGASMNQEAKVSVWGLGYKISGALMLMGTLTGIACGVVIIIWAVKNA